MARILDTTAEGGIIREEDFSVIMTQAFATYGLSVVTDRALPDARDGLKPVQRRILTGMLSARYLSSRPTVKSAEVVGLILGNYHPHGDASVYDTAVRMAQPFTLRYPLIEGQGNMGSEDGDAPAAYRYTEMRLSPLGAQIIGSDGIRDSLASGKGRIIVRAEVRLEETPRSRALIVTQLPPIGRDKVKVSIAKAINSRKLEGLLDMRDESDTEKGT